MGMLPWDDWIYNLPYRRDEVNSLHQQALGLQNNIQAQITTFNSSLDTYKSLIAQNAVLVLVANTIQMNDLLFEDFTVQVNAIEPPAAGIVPVEVASLIDEVVAGGLMLKGVFNLGKLAKNYLTTSAEVSEDLGQASVESLTEATAETGIEVATETTTEITTETVGEAVTEAAAETVIEDTTLAVLGETGIGIFAAVGIDLIFGVIDGAKEESELDDQINQLQTAINKCQSYLNTIAGKQATIDGGIVTEEQRFSGLVAALAKIGNNQPTFQIPTDATTANAQAFITAMQAAVTQYGTFVNMRDMWGRAVANNPQATKAEFISNYLMFAPAGVTAAVLNAYWDVLAQYSDSMRAQV